MNKKKTAKRLELNQDTIRLLSEPALAEVYGGLWTCGCTEGSCGTGCCGPYSNVCSGPICANAHVVDES